MLTSVLQKSVKAVEMGLLMTKMVEQGSRVGYICPITVGGELFVVVDGFTIFGDNIYHTDAVKLRSNIGQTRHVVLFWVQRNPRNQSGSSLMTKNGLG